MDVYMTAYSDISDLYPARQRERFKFQVKHLQILESAFNQNSYPNQTEREVIAHACNSSISNNGKNQS